MEFSRAYCKIRHFSNFLLSNLRLASKSLTLKTKYNMIVDSVHICPEKKLFRFFMEEFMANAVYAAEAQSIYILRPDQITYRIKMLQRTSWAGMLSAVAIGCIRWSLGLYRDPFLRVEGIIFVISLTSVFLVEYMSSSSRLFNAVRNGHLYWVRLHLFFGANPNEIFRLPGEKEYLYKLILNWHKNRAMAIWAKHRLKELEHNPEAYREKRITPLHCAVEKSSDDIVRVLLSYGADPDLKKDCLPSTSPLEINTQMKSDLVYQKSKKSVFDHRSDSELLLAIDRVSRLLQSAHDAKVSTV